jgi:IclR family KDG regulon transcriptional repressor
MARMVPALARGLDILELMLDGGPLSASEVAARLGLPRTTVHELLQTLVARRYLQEIPGGPRRYGLGARLFELGNVYAADLDLAREGQAVAGQIAARCGETVHVALLDGTDVFYVAKADSTHPVRMVSAVGRRIPAHLTAVGKMLLSGLSDETLSGLYAADRPLPAMTENSITSLHELRRALDRIRREGLAWDDCESNPSVNCVAAPVRDHSGAMAAAMSISVPTPRWEDGARKELAQLVHEGARELSKQLGAPAGGLGMTA